MSLNSMQGMSGSSQQYIPPSMGTMSTLTGAQQSVLSSLMQGMGLSTGQSSQGSSFAPNSSLSRYLSGQTAMPLDPTSIAGYFNQAVATPLMQQYNQTVVPAINQAYAGYGDLFSSKAGAAKQQSLQNMNQNIAQQLGNTQLQGLSLNAQMSQSAASNWTQMAMGLLNNNQMATYQNPGHYTQSNGNGSPVSFTNPNAQANAQAGGGNLYNIPAAGATFGLNDMGNMGEAAFLTQLYPQNGQSQASF